MAKGASNVRPMDEPAATAVGVGGTDIAVIGPSAPSYDPVTIPALLPSPPSPRASLSYSPLRRPPSLAALVVRYLDLMHDI